jgi:uncharacterized protein YxjI
LKYDEVEEVEHGFDQAVSFGLAPKVYALLANNGEQVIKVKGVKADIADTLNIDDFDALLAKDSSRQFSSLRTEKVGS